MKSVRVSGTEHYAEEAPDLLQRYETISFAETHRSVMRLIPKDPCRVLDIGSGTGRDAAGFAELGHRVVAVEPTEEMRRGAIALHPSRLIEWLDDSLPDLARVLARNEQFDVVMLTAVWMHLDSGQRERAMARIAGLLQPGGLLTLQLRHGPVPAGRRMFEVSVAETRALADHHGLKTIHDSERPALLAGSAVRWSVLALRAPT